MSLSLYIVCAASIAKPAMAIIMPNAIFVSLLFIVSSFLRLGISKSLYDVLEEKGRVARTKY